MPACPPSNSLGATVLIQMAKHGSSLNAYIQFISEEGLFRHYTLAQRVLLASLEQGLQHALDRFSAACNQAGMKIKTEKTEILCLSKNPGQCTLHLSGTGNTL